MAWRPTPSRPSNGAPGAAAADRHRHDPQIVEAPSDRSRCQLCREHIHLGRWRVGMPYRHAGLTVTKWHHPSCFAAQVLLCDYAPTGRACCAGDGTPIAKGQPRLVVHGAEGAHRKCYKPENAAAFLAELLEHAGVGTPHTGHYVPATPLNTVAGLNELLPAHRKWVLAALSGRAVGPAPTQQPPPEPATPPEACESPVAGTSTSVGARSPAGAGDPLFLDGCQVEVQWPQSSRGRVRTRTGTIQYRPLQRRRNPCNVYVMLTRRRRGGLRERKTSFDALQRRGCRVLSSPRVPGRRRWSLAEEAAARRRLEHGEKAGSVSTSLGRSIAALQDRMRKVACRSTSAD